MTGVQTCALPILVASLVKQRKDSIEQFVAGGRQELADKEQAEIALLERYQPPAADAGAIAAAIEAAVAETGATSPKEMGKVIAAARAKLAGQTVDGKALTAALKTVNASAPVTNSIRFADNGEQRYGMVSIYQMTRGEWQLLGRSDVW